MHISELAAHHVENPREIVQPGDELRVKILEIDSERRRLSLSAKRVEGQVLPVRRIEPERPSEDAGAGRARRRAREAAAPSVPASGGRRVAEPAAADERRRARGRRASEPPIVEPAEPRSRAPSAVEPQPSRGAAAAEPVDRGESSRGGRRGRRRVAPAGGQRRTSTRPTSSRAPRSSERGDGRAVRRADRRDSARASRRRSRSSRELGAAVLSADAVVHELYATERSCGRRARRASATRSSTAGASTARALARARVRGRRRPRAGSKRCCGRWSRSASQEFRARPRAAQPPPAAAVVEAPLLFEAGGESRYAATIAVVADDELRAARDRRARPGGARAARGAPAATGREGAPRATYVVVNDGTVAAAARAAARRARGARGVSPRTRRRRAALARGGRDRAS